MTLFKTAILHLKVYWKTLLLGTIFNLSYCVLTDAETKVLKKGLDFALIQPKTNHPDLQQNFNDFLEECD